MWPPPITCTPLKNLLLDKKSALAEWQNKRPWQEANYQSQKNYILKKAKSSLTDSKVWIGDLCTSSAWAPPPMLGVVPCITKARAAQACGYYLYGQGRFTQQLELERLQGVPPNRIMLKDSKVTCPQYRGMLGNAFSVPVAGRVALALLRSISTDATLPLLRDPWARGKH